MLDLPVYNSYFIIDLDDKSPVTDNPVAKTDLYTAGGEYRTQNGSNYIGHYHLYANKAAATGAEKTEDSKPLIAATSVTTQVNAASSKLVDNLVGSDSQLTAFEKAMLTTLVSQDTVLKKVAADECVTEDTIHYYTNAGLKGGGNF